MPITFEMIAYSSIVIFVYIASELASERETKSREGMKIMGLTDGTYYLGWFLLFLVFGMYNSLAGTLVYLFTYFTKINAFILFCTMFIYQISIFGLCWVFVALIPNTRGITMLSILFQIITMFFSVQVASQYSPPSLLHGLSFLPNVPLAQIIKQMFFWNWLNGEGLGFAQASQVYQGYSVAEGLLWLTFDAFLYCFLGFYMDQVIPSTYGVAKPWYFICSCCCKKANTGKY